jgi:hypothetical protein
MLHHRKEMTVSKAKKDRVFGLFHAIFGWTVVQQSRADGDDTDIAPGGTARGRAGRGGELFRRPDPRDPSPNGASARPKIIPQLRYLLATLLLGVGMALAPLAVPTAASAHPAMPMVKKPGGTTRPTTTSASSATATSTTTTPTTTSTTTATPTTTTSTTTTATPTTTSTGTLVLWHDGWGRGSVASSPAGINCIADSVKPSESDSGYGEARQSGTCSLSFPVGTVVTLTETPEVGSYFNSWLGPTSMGSDTTFRVTVGGPGYNTVSFVFCPANETCMAPL